MPRKLAALGLILGLILVVGCGGGSDLPDKLQAVLDRAEVVEQSAQAVPGGMRGYILYIKVEDLKAISEAEAEQLVRAAAAQAKAGDKGARVRMMTRRTKGWMFAGVLKQGDTYKAEFYPFDANRKSAVAELN